MFLIPSKVKKNVNYLKLQSGYNQSLIVFFSSSKRKAATVPAKQQTADRHSVRLASELHYNKRSKL